MKDEVILNKPFNYALLISSAARNLSDTVKAYDDQLREKGFNDAERLQLLIAYQNKMIEA